MDGSVWDELGEKFPRVPADFRVDSVRRPALKGKPIRAHERPVIALAFGPDSKRIAVSGGGLIPGAVDIRVFDVQSRELRTICQGHVMGVFKLAFDPRTGVLASASHDYSVILWELEEEDAIYLVGGPDAGVSRSGVGFIGTEIVIADGMTFSGEHASLTAIDLETGESRALLELDGDLGIGRMSILPSERLLALSIEEMRSGGAPEIRVLAADGAERTSFELARQIYDLAAVDEALLIATGQIGDDLDTEVFALDAQSGARKAARTLGNDIGASVAVAPNRSEVAVAYDRSVEICAVDSLSVDRRLDLGDEKACSVAWSPDGEWIAVGTLQKALRIFDAKTGLEHLG